MSLGRTCTSLGAENTAGRIIRLGIVIRNLETEEAKGLNHQGHEGTRSNGKTKSQSFWALASSQRNFDGRLQRGHVGQEFAVTFGFAQLVDE